MSPIRLIDLSHRGRGRIIGAWVVDERYLIDPGPALTAPTLLKALGGWRPEAILLTHIHLDHAGSAGRLARLWPRAEIWVHEGGARHLADPTRLIGSARRVYGKALDRLWGEPEPVPKASLRVVGSGERKGPFRILETAGHASHHLSYLHASGSAFVGDVAGIRIAPASAVLVPSVAPDFDPELWKHSLERIRAWGPSHLALTHFGRFADVRTHLAAVASELDSLMASRGDRGEVEAHVKRVLAEIGDQELAESYRQAARPETFAPGIQRYLSQTEPSALAEDR